MRRLWPILLSLLAVAGPAVAPAGAAESAAVRSERLTATLIADTDQVASGRPLQLGLRLRMAPGWHTYWRNPGDAGAAPELTLTLPDGATAGPIAWPTPQRMPEGPLMTYGYTGEVVLPVTVTPGAGPLHVEAAANWLVCERICVPEDGRFTLDLPAGVPAQSAEAPLFASASARLPRPSPFPATIAPDGTLSVLGAGLSATTVRQAWFFPAEPDRIEAAAPQPLTVANGVVRLALHPAHGFAPAATLAGVLVLRDPSGQESALALAATPGGAAAVPGPALVRTLLFALLGGLILNLMPCVFPVLAMKAIGIARLSGRDRREVRAHSVSYTAGVLLAFAALGLALLAARAAGEAAGWGFQFQSPVFVAALCWALFLVGLNLSGVFAVGGGLAGVGQGLAARPGHLGSFGTGVLAVVVATPCTAPFMGAAITAALAAPAAQTVLVFLALGVGLAAPYALLAAIPGLARILPRPGPWMAVLQGALAFPMYGAAVWLLWVLSLQAGSSGVLAAASGLLLLGFGAWALGLAQRAGRRGRRWGRGAALASALAAAALLAGLRALPPAAASAAADSGTETFSPARLAALRQQGRPVFVNMTAAWCVTCLVNERVALSPARVREAFARHRVAYLKGDWTSGDAGITAFLRAHDRDGVPLYLLYTPGAAAPVQLPQILTAAELLDQLDRLGS